MAAPRHDRSSRNHRPLLQRGRDCLPIGRLGDALSEADAAHVSTCPRCESELALWRSFVEPVDAAGEQQAIGWITAELRRRRVGDERPAARIAPLRMRPLVALAASLSLAVGAHLAWDPEPRVHEIDAPQTLYRGATVRAIAPAGDVAVVPAELRWAPVDGAVEYEVVLLEVDDTTVWRATSPTSRVTVPLEVRARIVPGKPLRWTVTARNAARTAVGVSEPSRFRLVAPRPEPAVAAASGGTAR